IPAPSGRRRAPARIPALLLSCEPDSKGMLPVHWSEFRSSGSDDRGSSWESLLFQRSNSSTQFRLRQFYPTQQMPAMITATAQSDENHKGNTSSRDDPRAQDWT